MAQRTQPGGRESTARRTAGLAAGLGAAILVSGVFFTGTGYIVVANVLAGGAIAVTAAYTSAVPDGGRLPGVLTPVVAALLGAWVIASAFIFGVDGPLYWSNVVLGALVTIMALTSAYGTVRSSRSTAARA